MGKNVKIFMFLVVGNGMKKKKFRVLYLQVIKENILPAI
jgi:hypothetical protein